jgi:hypothetical protein
MINRFLSFSTSNSLSCSSTQRFSTNNHHRNHEVWTGSNNFAHYQHWPEHSIHWPEASPWVHIRIHSGMLQNVNGRGIKEKWMNWAKLRKSPFSRASIDGMWEVGQNNWLTIANMSLSPDRHFLARRNIDSRIERIQLFGSISITSCIKKFHDWEGHSNPNSGEVSPNRTNRTTNPILFNGFRSPRWSSKIANLSPILTWQSYVATTLTRLRSGSCPCFRGDNEELKEQNISHNISDIILKFFPYHRKISQSGDIWSKPVHQIQFSIILRKIQKLSGEWSKITSSSS